MCGYFGRITAALSHCDHNAPAFGKEEDEAWRRVVSLQEYHLRQIVEEVVLEEAGGISVLMAWAKGF